MTRRGGVRIWPRPENADLARPEVLDAVRRWEEDVDRRLPEDDRSVLPTCLGGQPFPACFDRALAGFLGPQAITCFL